jgi:hypothetical protein
MTNQHQATPDDWAQQEDWANRSVFSDSSCLLELRDRIEALEATQQPLAFTGKVVAPIKAPITRDRDETGDCIIVHDTPALNSSLVERIATDAELCQVYNDAPEHGFGPALRAVYDLGREDGAAPTHPGPESSPAGSLVDRVQQSIDDHPFGEEARAAILEVAAWLREQDGVGLLAATVLTREANQ